MRRLRLRLLTAPLALVAVGSGLLVLTVSLTGNAASSPGRLADEADTPEEISTWSAQIAATSIARNRSAADELIANKVSVSDLPRSKSIGMQNDLPISLDEARNVADLLVVGTVTEQYLEWGEYPSPVAHGRVPFLISIISPDQGGDPVRVAQVTRVESDVHGLRLGYNSGDPLLEEGVRYAVLTERIVDPDAFAVILGHDYLVRPDDTLVPVFQFSDSPVEGANVSALSLATDD